MKKYKLIQIYPSIPNTMSIGKEVVWDKEMELYHHTLTLDTFKKKEVENFPEFWEKLENKEWEILSIKSTYDSHIIDNRNDAIDLWLEGYAHNAWCINSVKRLSDEKVLTLRDKVFFGEVGEITKFNIVNDEMLCNLDYSKISGYDNLNINSLRELPKPLFKTEDEIDLYGGETIYLLGINNWIVTELYDFHSKNPFKGATGNEFKYFSTKKAAEDYILMYKPVLSVKDIKNIIKENESNILGIGFHISLEKKAEEKLGYDN